ncbi:DUF4424 domain-containing protein [Pelagibacterium halotolerans]|uniref:DUF4424 domain-containing protein n=1 Tax=Pelagibacterium halotolerans TaxID=531813 RepID=UPI00384F6C39
MVAFAVLAGMAGGAFGNDTAATLGAGGLAFAQNDNIAMVSEELYLSLDEVRVTYEFENLTDEDQEVLVAFPMPDITGEYEGIVGYPSDNPENIFEFSTTFEGEPVAAELHQSVFALGVDRTKDLVKLGVPLAPHVIATEEAINALPDADKAYLAGLGLVSDMGFGEDEPHYFPAWTLKSAYTWTAVFPAGETVTVEHRYTPGLGGTVAVSFLYDDGGQTLADYERRYCLDPPVINAVRRNMVSPEDPWSAPYTEAWLEYVLSTGRNWAGPIGTFRMIVDKGRPENLVSFCGEGIEKTGPTTFEVVYKDFYPWDDIEVLFLVRHDMN